MRPAGLANSPFQTTQLASHRAAANLDLVQRERPRAGPAGRQDPVRADQYRQSVFKPTVK
jgi:hypothetical protein